MCLASLGRIDEGTHMFERARALQPRSTRPLIGLGMMSALAGRQDEARRYFREAVDLDPGDEGARTALARLEADVLAAAAARCASLDGHAREECGTPDVRAQAPR